MARAAANLRRFVVQDGYDGVIGDTLAANAKIIDIVAQAGFAHMDLLSGGGLACGLGLTLRMFGWMFRFGEYPLGRLETDVLADAQSAVHGFQQIAHRKRFAGFA
jgi:hypothetical protein